MSLRKRLGALEKRFAGRDPERIGWESRIMITRNGIVQASSSGPTPAWLEPHVGKVYTDDLASVAAIILHQEFFDTGNRPGVAGMGPEDGAGIDPP